MGLWKFLDGKKTNVGAAVVAFATYANVLGILDPTQIELINQIGTAIISLGLGHKAVKVVTD